MRNIYRISRARTRVTVARVFVVAVALVFAGVVTRTHDAANVLTQAVAVPVAAAASAEQSAPAAYFPAQYELHAGAPEPHIEAF